MLERILAKKIVIPNIGTYYNEYMRRKTTKPKIAKKLGICRNTLDWIFKEYASSNKAGYSEMER